jgi:chemosensory pili system protein ChpA (sensor histidine kinase/response regulator)
MFNSTHFDPAILAAVKSRLDSALSAINTNLEQYLGMHAANAGTLEKARDELRGLTDLLKAAHLNGVAVFCAELGVLLGELAANPNMISGAHHDVLRRALSGLENYLDALSFGADNAALRLFPQYQELQQLRGLEMAFDLDLFYPDLSAPLPRQVLSEPPQEGTPAHLKVLRSQYQQGLMRWLRQDDVHAALTLMQQALGSVMRCMPQDDGRAIWWVAGGLLDCLRFDGLPPELNARKLLGRIDQQMRAVIEDHVGEPQQIMNEMLYLIGNSHTVSDLVDAIKQTYALDRYLPELSVLPPGETAQLLNFMHDQSRLAEESWERCVQGDQAAYAEFVDHAGQLALRSKNLEHSALHYLAKQIHVMAQFASEPERMRLIAMDMAMALLLLGSGIRHYSRLSRGFQEQAHILLERMRASARRQPEDRQKLAALVELHCQMEHGDVMVPLANEMLANLQYVEQGMNAFFSGTAKYDELAGLLRLLSQVRGGLHISSLDQAEQLLSAIQENIRHLARESAGPKPVEGDTLVIAVGALEDYLQHLAHGQAGDVSMLQAASAGMARLLQAPAQASVMPEMPRISEPPRRSAPPRISAQVQRPIGEDQELLEVFLEEAQEVLRLMRDNLEICQLHPDSRVPLATIRRGFHTLKGSGRMVGLTDIGEVAWYVERAMNKWLQGNQPATPELLNFINRAVLSFAGWVDALKNHGGVRIEADELMVAAQQIEAGIATDHVAEAVEAAAMATPAGTQIAGNQEPASGDAVVIGEITLSAALFNIASAEAMQHVRALHQQFAMMQMNKPPFIQYDFMRAAHTLAGVNRTMGFAAVAELASALEGWLQARLEKTFTLNNQQVQMLVQAIVALDEMVQKICTRQMPKARDDLAEQLQADKDQLHEEMAVGMGLDEVSEIGGAVETGTPPATGLLIEPAETNKTEAPDRTGKPQVHDDVDEQLLPLFLEETHDLCPKIGSGLRALRGQPHDEAQLQLLKRLLHTLKGSARMAGAMRIGEIAHEMEGRVLAGAQMRDRPGYWDDLESDFDRITGLLEELHGGALKGGETKATKAGEAGKAEAGETAAKEAETAHETPHRRVVDRADAEHRISDTDAERALSGNMLRVRSDVIDRMVNEAGEISVARSRMETEMRAFKEGLLELTGSVSRLRKQLREMEIQAESQMQARASLVKEGDEQFDPLEFDRFTRLQELTRFMNESVHDVQTVQQALLKNFDETTAAMLAQARLNRELQQSLMSVRMVPFASISERLYRIVRQTAKELGKRANLELIGTTVELDRSVLEKMTAPFEHLLRNAVVHGLESEWQRLEHGKGALGEIRLSLRQANNEVVFEFGDDGAGLNFGALREKALSRGLLRPDEAVSNDQLAQLIFVSGISTATEVTEVAGRGIGMDVVRSEISALGGRIDVHSSSGQGTRFIIHLPLTLAVAQTLMVRSGNATYAIPSTMVEQVRQMKPAGLAQLYRDRQIEWQEKSYPFHYLAHLLGDTGSAPESLPRNAVLLLRSGEQRIALHVDGLLGNMEAVVKNIGPQLTRLPWIAGATVSGDGRVVLILSPVQLAQRIATATGGHATATPAVLHTQPLVMVVDDSLTVRKITTRLLQRAGYQVITAKDGVDALEQLGENNPAVMLLDIEMPRMDGFELTKHLRRDDRTKSLPIIMITSRTADKHRDYAMQLGVNAYLGKPYQEDELLQQVAKFAAMNAPVL